MQLTIVWICLLNGLIYGFLAASVDLWAGSVVSLAGTVDLFV